MQLTILKASNCSFKESFEMYEHLIIAEQWNVQQFQTCPISCGKFLESKIHFVKPRW